MKKNKQESKVKICRIVVSGLHPFMIPLFLIHMWASRQEFIVQDQEVGIEGESQV